MPDAVIETIQDWNDQPVRIARSGGSQVIALANFDDQLIRGDVLPWPPPAIVQKLYRSGTGEAVHYPTADRPLLRKRLGYHSDLQSVHSEDVITWNFFGPFLAASPDSRAAFLDWLAGELKVPLDSCTSCHIDLFRRIPHPETGVSGGPENDVVIDADSCVIFVEAKWLSSEGKAQGQLKNKTQTQLRQEFLAQYGQAIYGDRSFVVLGIGPLLDSVVGAQAINSSVPVKAITWATLATYPEHPCGDEFARYYAWKRELSRPRKAALLPSISPS